MPGNEPEDESSGGPPPDPSDRIWVHPTEMTSFVATTRPRASRRGRWVALAAGLTVVAAVAGVVALMTVDDSSRPTPSARSGAIQRVVAPLTASGGAVRTARGEHPGGALVDTRGEVVGILVVPPDSSTAGLALPIDQARDVASQLTARGSAEHGWLGVWATDDTDLTGGGARVQGVVPGSPAASAGLVQGDVIVDVGKAGSTTAISSRARTPCSRSDWASKKQTCAHGWRA